MFTKKQFLLLVAFSALLFFSAVITKPVSAEEAVPGIGVEAPVELQRRPQPPPRPAPVPAPKPGPREGGADD